MADGGPGFVDVLHAALGGSLDAVTVSGPHGDPVPAAVLRVGHDGVRRERAGRRAAPVLGCRSRPPRARAWASWCWPRWPAARRPSWSVWVGPAPTTAARACWPPSARRADGVLDGGAAPLGAVTTVDLSAARSRLDGVTLVAASDVDNPLTGLFGATKTFGPQKGVAEDRIAEVDGVARGASPPPPTGVRRWRRAPAPPAASATPCSSSAPPGSRASAWSRPRGRPGRAGPRVRPGRDRRGRLRLLQPGRQGAVRRGRRRRGGRCVPASPSPARCSSARARCAPSASSRRTPWSTSWGRSAPSAHPPTPWPTSPRGSRAPGRADAVAGRGHDLGE